MDISVSPNICSDVNEGPPPSTPARIGSFEDETPPVDFLTIARQAHEWGLAVLPCEEGTKRPDYALLSDGSGYGSWKKFQTRRATADQIETWAAASPHANPAIICGLPSRVDGQYLFVVDIEDRGLLEEMHQALTHKWGETWAIESYRGGHLYFVAPQPVKAHKLSWQGHSFEVRGQGSYVMAWGARHPSGVLYKVRAMPDQIASATSLAPYAELEFLDPKTLHTNDFETAYGIARRLFRRRERDRRRQRGPKLKLRHSYGQQPETEQSQSERPDNSGPGEDQHE